jgi:TonB family protein
MFKDLPYGVLTSAALTLLLGVLPIRAEAAQQPPTSSSSLLTAGAVALLGNDLDEEAVQRLRIAMTHEDPIVRAVAARVAGNAKVSALAADVAAALEREQDESAAAEQMRALLFLGDLRAASETTLPRSKMSARIVYIEWLVRTRPEAFVEHIERALHAVPTTAANGLSAAVAAAVVRNPAARDRLLRAWLRVASAEAWRSVLEALDNAGLEIEPGVLQAALTAENSSIREETVWAVVSRLARDVPMPAGALDAALPLQAAGSGSESNPEITWETFGRELVARRRLNVQTPDRAEFLRMAARRRKTDAGVLRLLKELTAAERKALVEAIRDSHPGTAAAREAQQLRGAKARVAQPTMRTVPIPWPDLFVDLLKVSGCQISNRPAFGAYRIAYRPDGRPASLNLDISRLPRDCKPVLDALARLTLADVKYDVQEGQTQWVIVPIHKEFLACLLENRHAGPPRDTHAGNIEPPKNIRDVPPEYPRSALQAHVQGAVILETFISTTGCVTQMNVLQSVDQAVDLAAIRSVSEWRFTPTRVDGQAVPVIITAIVEFKLH